ncbi:MAG TPA: amidophosphoribosyltransferase [bacterium]|nr:amidophosphoribosyltransferase [bacterium]HQL63271.1 amidophosphoribosyltransferase [bacterium]
MSETIRDACGVFGIAGHPESANMTYLGLYALQHRGQESAGIVTTDGTMVYNHRGMGLVADVFSESVLRNLIGSRAIGHVRYSTTGSSDMQNVQPVLCQYQRGWVAIAHNGNLINTDELRSDLESRGSIFSATTDSEILAHLLARSRKDDFLEALQDSLLKLNGAYSMTVMNSEYLVGLRDPLGIRPLCLGELNGAPIFCSESCALDIINARYIRTVNPGEMVIVDRKCNVRSHQFANRKRIAQCIFELIYFARPDSWIYGKEVHAVRKNIGRVLSRERRTNADVVIAIPDSSTCAALGFAEESGIPFDWGIIRNHYIGRTFIEPTQRIRDFGAKIKYNPVGAVLADKRVVVVDDSIVRGTTMRKIIKMIRRAGAREVHLRISAPVFRCPCYYGIDTPTRNELIGATHQVEEIRKQVRADTIHYISIQGLLEAVHGTEKEYCTACFNGKYPLRFPGGLPSDDNLRLWKETAQRNGDIPVELAALKP